MQPSLLTAGGIVVISSIVLAKRLTAAQVERMEPVQAFLAIALFVMCLSWLIKGPLKIIPWHAPPLVLITMLGVSYGALAGGICLAFPKRAPKPAQALIGTFCVATGVLLLLLQLRVIKPI